MNDEQRNYIEKLQKKREEFEQKSRKLYAAGSTKHSHAEISDWLKCFPCMIARKNQLEERKKMGLGSSKDYMKWRKANTITYDDKLRRARDNVYNFGRMI